MDDVALANYIAGTSFEPVEIGRIDRVCAELLGVEPGTQIVLSDYTLLKVRAKHGEIDFASYRHMPNVLLQGFLARGRKRNTIDLWWVDQAEKDFRAFVLVLKATIRREVFATTFYRIDRDEAERLLKKAYRDKKLVRRQSGVENILFSRT